MLLVQKKYESPAGEVQRGRLAKQGHDPVQQVELRPQTNTAQVLGYQRQVGRQQAGEAGIVALHLHGTVVQQG